MITESDVLVQEIPKQIVDKAVELANPHGKNFQKTIMGYRGRLTGYVAELMFMKYLRDKQIAYQYMNGKGSKPSYNYDFIINNQTYDVKAKRRTVPTNIKFEASVASYQHQECDLYVFISLLSPNLEEYTKAYFMGWVPKKQYMKICWHREKGEIDKSNGNRCLESCDNIYYHQLEPMGTLFNV